MIIYKDFISGDELLSDAHKIRVVDDFFFEVDARLVTKGGEEKYEIGANPSQEEEEEALQDTSEQVLDIVKNFHLVETKFEKKDFTIYIKGYVKKLRQWLHDNKSEEEALKFEKNAPAAVKKLLGNFKELDIYLGESMNPDASMVYLNYRDVDGTEVPYFTYFKDALVEEKV